MNETEVVLEDEPTLKTAVASLLRVFQAEYDWNITTDRRDLLEENLSNIKTSVILKTLSLWIKSEDKRIKISQFLDLARHYDEDSHDKNKKLYIIDASCRLSGSVGATIASGLNLPEILISLGNRKIIKKTINKKNLYFFPVKIFYSKNQLH